MLRNHSRSKKYEIDMCSGPLTGKLVVFAVPLMLSGILQLLFNAADIVVVGRFAGNHALAAVGATSSLINLLVNLFMGLSVGANVLVARFYGGNQEREIGETVHTAVLTAAAGGLLLAVIGFFLSRPLLAMMGTPEDVLDYSVLYMRIYFAGMPVMLLYNYGSSILRAIGDTKRPLYYLTAAGVVNVILNLIFVIYFHMGVAGVALATVISQVISAALIIRCLMRSEGSYRLEWSRLRFYPDKFLKIKKIGIPAGLQGSVFSISNVLIQSSVNSFGSVAMAGNTAAANIEGFVYTAMNALHQTALSFAGQNIGARKYGRVYKIMGICLGMVTIVGLVLGNGASFFGKYLLGMYSSDVDVIQYGMVRLSVICTTYFLCGLMDVMVGVLRGMGYAVMPMVVSLTGACGLRVLWVFTIFAANRSLFVLYLSYPVTWTITFAAHLLCFLAVRKKVLALEAGKDL